MGAIQLFCCFLRVCVNILTTSATLSLRYFASSVIRAPFVIQLYLKHTNKYPQTKQNTNKKQNKNRTNIAQTKHSIIVSGKFNVR